jgi:hypothetical protein
MSVLMTTAATVAGCGSVADDPSDGVAVSELHNDLRTPATVAVCADSGCRSLAGSVTDVLRPGQSMPVNVATDVDESYAVIRTGEPTRCLPVAAHPYSSRPTLPLSAAESCSSAVAAAPASSTAISGWLAYALVLILGVLAWVVAIRSAIAVYRRLKQRPTGAAAAAVLSVLAGILVLLLLWPIVLIYAIIRRFGRRPPVFPAGPPQTRPDAGPTW